MWNQKEQVKKGNLGEQLVEQYLERKGWIIYRPPKDKPHVTDRFCVSPDKKQIIVAEIKSKARRTKYPDSGFNLEHYGQYCYLRNKYNLPVFVYFVDEHENAIYGNTLTELEKPRTIEDKGRILHYPIKQGAIIYFPCASMVTVTTLTNEQCEILKKFSNRSYKYPEREPEGGKLFE